MSEIQLTWQEKSGIGKKIINKKDLINKMVFAINLSAFAN